MKKLSILLVFMTLCAVNMMAQSTPWKIIDMEDVSRHGSNAEYDDETLTATFKNDKDRWIDLPGVKGDINGHTMLHVKIMKANCMLKFAVRYKDENGKAQQAIAATCYSSMGKTIKKEKLLKIDLTNKGKITEAMLKDVIGIRVAMAKGVEGKESPWEVTFGEVAIC